MTALTYFGFDFMILVELLIFLIFLLLFINYRVFNI